MDNIFLLASPLELKIDSSSNNDIIDELEFIDFKSILAFMLSETFILYFLEIFLIFSNISSNLQFLFQYQYHLM